MCAFGGQDAQGDMDMDDACGGLEIDEDLGGAFPDSEVRARAPGGHCLHHHTIRARARMRVRVWWGRGLGRGRTSLPTRLPLLLRRCRLGRHPVVAATP